MMSTIELVEYLHKELLVKLSSDGNEHVEELTKLNECLSELCNATQHYQDMFLYQLFDDMSYVIEETMMGARPKGEALLPSISARVYELRQKPNN